MTDCDERRLQGIKRVPVATLVEICGNQPGVPAFEGRSLDVSGRGMHVRTTYVPKVGDPLICRFENQGREIVVEGVVAWRREGDTGGDFGIEFTALDSQSVDALRALCGVAPPEPSEESEAPAPPEAPAAPEPCLSGAKVRLHIDGLGSPMKANVRDAGRRRVKVGSQLQFLQVGRHLEIEDVTVGARLSARIDAVDVRVDPRTQVPELVVALRYDHVDATPEPSVVDQSPEASPYPEAPDDPAALQDAVVGSDDPEEAAAREAEAEMLAEQKAADQARLAVDRLGTAAQGAAQAAKATSRVLARFGQSAAAQAGSLFKGAGKQLLELKKQRPAATKRQTALPPGGPRTFQKLRPQGAPRQAPGAASQAPRPTGAAGAPVNNSDAATTRRRGSRVAFIAGGLAVIGATAAYALRDVDGPASTPALPALAAAAPAASVAAAKPAATPGKPAALKAGAKTDDTGGIVANVPLFGPTPMATMEPAPLEPELTPADEEAQEKAAAAAAVDDATWPEETRPTATAVNPADVKPWGRGRMHLPTIHKLRLDGAGASISGSVNDSGFTVVVPGRKVMESGRAIQRRDERIAQVKTSNTAAGAQITFQFRGKVPAYRVRLRNDFAEFLISAPEG